MLIRHADPRRDAAVCAAIYAPSVSHSVVSFEERVPNERDFAERIGRISLTHPWLVGEEGGRVIGFAYACPHRERAAYRWAADVTVYVDSDYHRRGIGRTLYQRLFELLVRQGLQVVCAGITLPNTASVGLHESLGFRPVGVYRRIGWKFGAWHDVGWWQLELLPADGSTPPAEPGPPARLD
jgi:L-amino acid N-acyltransferase YncA